MSDPAHRPRRLVYGRRQGHRLRAGQQRLMDDLLPRLRVPCDPGACLDPRTLFPGPVRAIWLEIGFGGGEHLVWQAAAHPDVGLIGCEPFVNGVAKLLAAVESQGLDNVRIHDDDARAVLELLPPQSVERVFMLYPDPWPKTRHHKRRLVQPHLLDRLADILVDGGEFRFSSDIPDYIRWSLIRVRAHGAFEWTARRPSDWRSRPADWPQTRYEAKALAAGRKPAYLRFVRRAR